MPRFSRASVFESVAGAAPERVAGISGAFDAVASAPRIRGEPPGTSTPEELLAAAHAACWGIGLRALLAQRGGSAQRLTVQATVTADKGPGGIRVVASHIEAQVGGLHGIAVADLPELAERTSRGCTISNAFRAEVALTHRITWEPAQPALSAPAA